MTKENIISQQEQGKNSEVVQNENGDNLNQNSSQENQNEEIEQPKFDFVKELGMSEDEVKKLISEKHEADENNKTAEVKLAEALEKVNKAELKVAAMQLGVRPDTVDDVIAIASVRDPEGKNLKSTIAELLKQYPQFSNAELVRKAKGTGGSLTGAKDVNPSEDSLGKRLASSKKVQGKSFYFSK